MYICKYVCIYTGLRVYRYISIQVYRYIGIYVYRNIFIRVYICIYIYTYNIYMYIALVSDPETNVSGKH